MELTGFLVVAPSRVAAGEPFALGIKALAEPYVVGAGCYGSPRQLVNRFNHSPRGIVFMDNSPRGWTGRIAIAGGAGYRGPETYEFSGQDGAFSGDDRPIARIGGLRFDAPGVHTVEVREARSGIAARSNAILVTDGHPPERLYWGDLHSHTFFSDGLRAPEELCAFARDEAFLDIFALSDHAESLTDRQWDYHTAVIGDFYRPHAFVTLAGFEWTSRRFGHRNVYYPGDRGPLLRASDSVQGELEHLYRVAREQGALVIPHHSANVVMGVDWHLGHDPQVERLAEVYSVWGNSERSAASGNPYPIRTNGGEQTGRHVTDALAQGRRFGFVGGGDSHDGRPGDELHTLQKSPATYHLLRRQGLMGVWAPELTREAVFEALWQRRVFASTNSRLALEFEVCGRPMGSQVAAAGRRPIRVRAIGASAIVTRIGVVRNGEDWASHTPNSQDATFEIDDPEHSLPSWYYTRITCADGHMAWSSPVWVDDA